MFLCLLYRFKGSFSEKRNVQWSCYRTQVIDEGKTLALTVLVTKLNTTESIKYRWYYKSSDPAFPSPAGNESTLQLMNLKADNTGIYFCVVSVAQSIITTEEIEVVVNCKMKLINFLLSDILRVQNLQISTIINSSHSA